MTEGLIETLKGINDKIDYPLSNRVNLNLSKEQVDAIIFYLEKIAELEKQIEKMKCCMNCKYFDSNEPKYCNKGVFNSYVCDKWELAE